MQTQQHSRQFLKQRKFLTVLPLLIIPFLTMSFWSLGGGKGTSETNNTANKPQGINLQLPNATLKEDAALDKLSFYNKAKKDSLAFEDAVKSDPYYKKYTVEDEAGMNDTLDNEISTEDDAVDTKAKYDNRFGLNSSPKRSSNYTDPNEKKVREKLEQLKKAMNETTASNAKTYEPHNNTRSAVKHDEFTTQIDKLEGMMQTISSANEPDPEMQQLENMMDKIMDLQHPERVEQKLKEQSREKEQALFTVSATVKSNNISLLQSANDTIPGENNNENAFFSLDESNVSSADTGNALHAVVYETQTLVNGAVIKLRLMQDAYINGIKIPAGNFIYGTVSLNNERLQVEISSIRFDNSLYPVKLKVYDLDGLEGIYMPGAIGSELVKQSSDNALQDIGMMSVDPSLTEQAASAGISAAKTIFSKKVKLVKVTVKAGYQVLLKN